MSVTLLTNHAVATARPFANQIVDDFFEKIFGILIDDWIRRHLWWRLPSALHLYLLNGRRSDDQRCRLHRWIIAGSLLWRGTSIDWGSRLWLQRHLYPLLCVRRQIA